QPEATHVEREGAVALAREHAREREPLAEVAVGLVREHDALRSLAEQNALELRAVGGPELDPSCSLGWLQAVPVERRRCGRRHRGSDHEQEEGDAVPALHLLILAR